MRARYRYWIAVSDTITENGYGCKQVSAKEFKDLSHHWDASKEDENGITDYTVDGIFCGRRIRQ